MSKMTKILQSMLLAVMILFSSINNANAFLPIPPMPGMPELDIPGNVTKVISNIQSVVRQVQTYAIGIVSGDLTAMKVGPFDLGSIKDTITDVASGDIGAITDTLGVGGGASTPSGEVKGANKTPGTSGILADQDLGLSENSADEVEYFNAFHKLFVLLPSKDDYTGDYNVMISAFSEKRTDYQQDIIVDTYLAGKMNEDLLNLVDRTLNRLDLCLVGQLEENDCVFFGMQMVKKDPNAEEPGGDSSGSEGEGEGEESGSVGDSINAYIVSTVYDRLLRIVEDLAAIEAVYESSKQIDLIEPIATEDSVSSADDYIPTKYHFAYKSSNEFMNAKIDFSKFKVWEGVSINAKKSRDDRCKNGKGASCPAVNTSTTDTSSMNSTEIYKKLKPIDDILSEAVAIHNLKVDLFEYKTAYRKYLKAIEIHNRALKVLNESDKCVVNFINRHAQNRQGDEVWYGLGTRVANDYDNRQGVSRELIEKYQQYTTDTLIGTQTDTCRGFYELNACPSGYVSDTANPCEENKDMYPCIVKTITKDISQDNENFEPTISEDYTTVNVNGDAYDETDGLQDGNDVDNIDRENRKKSERAWRIGADKLTDLAKQGVLEFKQWNDQKNLQKEYLTNKYRNIRMIARSIDKGLNAYKVSSVLMGGFKSDVEPMGDLIEKLTAVKTPQQAVEDGSAIRSVISQEPFLGFSLVPGTKPGDKHAVKTVRTSYIETIVRTVTNEDGTKSEVSVEQPKFGSIKLKCEAKVSDTPGYIDIVEEVYVEGTKDSKKQVVHKEMIDLRIRDKQNSYASEFTRDPLTIEDLADLPRNTESCPKGWDFTITGIVRNFLKPTLGGCGETTQEQVENLRITTQKAGRIVAQDMLDYVKDERKKEEAKMVAFIKDYNDSIESLKKKKEDALNKRTQWTTKIDTLTKDKNDIANKKQESKEQVKAIEGEIESIKSSKGNSSKPDILTITKAKYNVVYAGSGKDFIAKKVAREEEYYKERIAKLETLANCIENSEEGYCLVCEEFAARTDCAKNPNVSEKTFKELSQNAKENKTLAFISYKQADNNIKQYDDEIKSLNIYLEDSKDLVKNIEADIADAADTFAEDYVEKAEDMQDTIEKANKTFETFVKTDDEPRMIGKETCVGNGPFKECTQYKDDDSLELTIENFISENEKVKDYAKRKILEIWLNGTNMPDFDDLGLPDVVSVAENIDLGLDVPLKPGKYYSFSAVLDEIKEQIAEIAATRVYEKIKKSDEIMTAELKATLADINNWSGSTLCLPGDGEAELSSACVDGLNVNPKYNYTLNVNYLAPKFDEEDIKEGQGSITLGHKTMIKNIITPTSNNRSILESAGIELKDIFGVPNEDLIDTDSEYFVALPARGINNTSAENENICQYAVSSSDNGGCDYMAPKEPLASLPPLREIFYFSGADYHDVPKSKKRPKGTIDVDVYAPSIATLLDFKYEDEKFEYLPEVWRYILARPNMRNDGKYQQTFIERAYGKDKIISYLQGFDNGKMRLLLARSGVFPCKLEGKTIDLKFDANIEKNKDKIEKVAFQYTNNSRLNNQCKDVAFHKEYIQHLLADDNNAKKDKDNTAYAKIEKEAQQGVYNNFSELAQFIYVDEVPRRQAVDGDRRVILYRRLLSNVFNRITSKDDSKNNVERQLAEGISFKRNVMGSFLENVNKEFLARKSKENSKEDIKSVLKTLCSKIHEFGNVIGDEGGLEGDEKLDKCAEIIMSKDEDNDNQTGGLALSPEDNKYNVESCGVSNSYYDTIYCMLDNMKAEKVDKAIDEYKSIIGEDGNKKFSPEEIDIVSERLDEIKNTIASLEEDKNEVTTIQPGYDADKTREAVDKAKVDRQGALNAAESAITSMDNQSRNVAYCPIY